MQVIGQRLSRLPMARAFLAGAAIIAGASSAASARDAIDEVAMVTPRLRGPDATPLTLPRPLSAGDAARIRRIFAQQACGDIPAAVAETANLADATLLGHILADRYLGPARSLRGEASPCRAGKAGLGGENLVKAARASSGELGAWLATYGDLPDAPAIRSLLLSTEGGAGAVPGLAAAEPSSPAARGLVRNPVLDRSVREPARAGQSGRALRLIAHTKGLTVNYGALLRAEVAQALFSQGRDHEALRIALSAHHDARGEIGLAPFVAGLTAWRMGQTAAAGVFFEAVRHASIASDDLRAAADFWAARARLSGRNRASATTWLERAASHPDSFYGLLAARILADAAPAAEHTLAQADIDAVLALPGGLRAFALLQVGQPVRAAAELHRIAADPARPPGIRRAAELVARAASVDPSTERAGATLRTPAAPSLPFPRLRPAGGFAIDPAMLYAMARTESNFDPKAISPAGARGLLQIMPLTAEYLVKKTAAPKQLAQRLHDPASNLDLGQRYVLYLAEHGAVGGDLIRLLAGYNAGPGNLRSWEAAMRDIDDPLLFIEAIPNDETRTYVPRVLAYTWLYAAQMGLPAPSLDELAAGRWPRFTPREDRQLASRLH